MERERYRERERERERETETETETDRDRQTNRRTETDRDRKTETARQRERHRQTETERGRERRDTHTERIIGGYTVRQTDRQRYRQFYFYLGHHKKSHGRNSTLATPVFLKDLQRQTWRISI